jgi:hypothetical protein
MLISRLTIQDERRPSGFQSAKCDVFDQRNALTIRFLFLLSKL